MKAELYKFKKDISVWIISFILVCCASISIFTEVYSSAENTVLNLGKDSVILILACAIYVGFSCTDDFTNRTVIYAITYGNRRLQILLAKYCSFESYLGRVADKVLFLERKSTQLKGEGH